MSPIEYASLPRDSKREVEVLKWLRRQNDHDKFEFVWRVLMANVVLGLVLVERSNLKPIYLEVILEHGFIYGDASSVRGWYEAIAAGLGIKKVILMVHNHIEDAPLIVNKMIYWLRPDEEELKKQAADLSEQFSKRYPGLKSSRSTGIHATSA